MAIEQINNQEGGRSVRDKLNGIREEANQVVDKITKISTAVAGNVAVFGSDGQLVDSGVRPGGGESVNIPTWQSVQNIPLAINFVVQYNGRLFANLVDQNQNNEPPLEGENTFWRETSEAQSTATPLYSTGIYRETRAEVYVVNSGRLDKYVLTVTQLPFISTDFAAELTAGQWQLASTANLTITRDASVVNVVSEIGSNATLPSATTTLAGVMSAADKVRLNNAAVTTEANNFEGDQTINGNLNVVGDITFVNQQEISTADNLIDLNVGEVGAGVTGGFSGLVVDRGTLQNFGIIFRETDDLFRVGVFDTLRGSVVSATSTTIVLDENASSTDDFYNGLNIRVTKSGTLPQFRIITDYIGATKTATIGTAWTTIPDNTYAYRALIEDDTQAVLTRVDTPNDGLPFLWDATNSRALTRALTDSDISNFETRVKAIIEANVGMIGSLSFNNQIKIAAVDTGVNVTGAIVATGAVTAASFSGNGASLTNLNASNIVSGTLTDARLSSNVALKNANNNFSVIQTGVTFNATSSLQIGGVSINTAGTLSNVVYSNGANGANFVYGDNSSAYTDYGTATDLNSIFKAGFYTLRNGTNAPETGDGGLINVPNWRSQDSSNRYNLQLYSRLEVDRLWFRTTDSDGDGDWNQIYHSGNANNSTTSWNASSYSIASTAVIDSSRNLTAVDGTFTGNLNVGGNGIFGDFSGAVSLDLYQANNLIDAGGLRFHEGDVGDPHFAIIQNSFDNKLMFQTLEAGTAILLDRSTGNVNFSYNLTAVSGTFSGNLTTSGRVTAANLSLTGLSHTNGQLLSIGTDGVISAIDAPTTGLSFYDAEISNWNMDTISSFTIGFGTLNLNQIRRVTAIIYNDAGTFAYNFEIAGTITIGPGTVVLERDSGGFFDSTDFSSSTLRGRFLVEYV